VRLPKPALATLPRFGFVVEKWRRTGGSSAAFSAERREIVFFLFFGWQSALAWGKVLFSHTLYANLFASGTCLIQPLTECSLKSDSGTF
jgi:hypothetical protein